MPSSRAGRPASRPAAVGAPGAAVLAGRLGLRWRPAPAQREAPRRRRPTAAARPARPPSGRALRVVAGRRHGSWIHARSIGSSMMPVSMPLSQWSNQRTNSCRNPIVGPGAPPAGRRGTTARSAPCAARAGPRAAAGSRWCSRRPSRRPRTRRTRWRRSPRTPSPASSTRRGAGAPSQASTNGRCLHPLEPHVAPAVADGRRVGRPRQPNIDAAHSSMSRVHAAAVVVHVVGVAVVGRAEGDDRLQRRRPAGGDLQAVEPAPRDADHADLAAAPRLLGEPRDHLQPSSCSCGRYSSSRRPSDSPVPRWSTRTPA